MEINLTNILKENILRLMFLQRIGIPMKHKILAEADFGI